MPRKKLAEDSRSQPERQRDFLTAYADTLSVVRAAEIAKVDRTQHHRWLRKSPDYAKAFEKIKSLAGEYLETEAIARAGEGWLENVWYQGEVCGQVRRYDSGLAQFLLKSMMPARYGARTEVSGPQGAPDQAKIEVVFVKPTAPDL
jgi:hypothetical protein